LTREHQLQALFGEATLVTSVFLDAGYKRTLEKKHWLQTYMGVGTLFTGVFSRQKSYSRLFSQKNRHGLKA
jgi:hypothetical protein